MLIPGNGLAGAPAKADMWRLVTQNDANFKEVAFHLAAECIKNHLRIFHTFEGLPHVVALNNFEFFKHLPLTSDLGPGELAMAFYSVFRITTAQADAASANVLCVINLLHTFATPGVQTHVQLRELACYFRG